MHSLTEKIGRLMNDTLTLNKLEKLIEVENKLRSEYQQQLDAKDATISQLNNDKAALETKLTELEATIATQLATITEMSAKSGNTQALEQRNRELHNRSENMKEEVATVKSRIKALQKDLAAERSELAELKKYDPQRLRKNLDASKKKLAEKTTAADKLHKLLNQARAENTELEQKIKALETELETLKPEEATDAETAEQAAA
jgi:chromosome segregation ATPase